MIYIDNAIPRVFGDGLMGKGATALARIPAFMAGCITALIVGELVMRGVSNTFAGIGFKPAEDGWLNRAASFFQENGARPYADTKQHTTLSLTVKFIAFAALAIVGSEFVRVAGGAAPAIYNHVLTVLGPIRIDSAPYLDNLRALLALAGYGA